MRPTSLPLIYLLLAPLPAGGQQAEPTDEPPAGSFFAAIEVNVVNVDVYVTDKQGNPLTGLEPEDFELYEDGRRMEITNFLEVTDGKVQESSLPPSETLTQEEQTSSRPPEPSPEVSSIRPSEPEPLYLAIYVDNFNTSPANRRWALSAVERFLVTKVSPEDRVMLVTYDRGVNIRQTFTDDPMQVLDALRESLRLVANRSSRDSERREILEEIFSASSSSSAEYAARRHADYVHHEMGFALSALRDLVTSLAGIDGRKALLHISDGVPEIVGEELFMAVEQQFLNAGARVATLNYDLRNRYEQLANLANSSGVTLYTLDAKGMRADASISAEYSGDLQHTINANLNLLDTVRTQNLAAPLYSLAAETGGQAFVQTNALDDALGAMAQDFRTYYSLGYRRPPSGSERSHEIEVRVGRKGVVVRHREGYREKSPETRLREGTEATLRHGFEKNPLGVSLVFSKAKREDSELYRLPLEVRIPLRDLTLIPQGDVHRGRLQVAVAVADENGRTTPVLVRAPFDPEVPRAELPQALERHLTYELELQVRGGRQQIAVAVQDLLAGRASYVREPIVIRQ